MKCVKKGEKIQRVSEDKAINLVDEWGWKYCPKHEWKEQNKAK